ncbi:MAG: hypothetical protein GF330_01040 [Candidatus Eisenbacteria bacterium]|nr:hypothetical protein [Candidatus Eisenbacteria bacterium]
MSILRTGRILPAAILATLLLVPAAAADLSVSRDDAVALTTEMLLGGTTEGVRLFICPHPIEPGETIATWKRDVFTAPAAGWFLFIDRFPAANWEHLCHYVFVDGASGEIDNYEAMVPPALQEQLDEITSGRDNPPVGASERALYNYRQRLAQLPRPTTQDRGRAFAFIISGGANQSNNHIRYWNDSAFIYTTLVDYYGYPDENIYVCISDGLDPAPDRSDGTNSPPDLDGDGDDDIQYPATYVYIEQVFDELSTILTASDQLFLFTTDHGGQEAGWDCYLNLWNWEELRDDQLAAFCDALPCQTIIGTFEQCFSGGMIDDLEGEGRVISTAARWDEYSWAMGPDYIYDTYVYFWTSAVNWADPYGNPVDADTNDDGVVSMREAFVYAEANDHEDETPQYSSTPADLGDALTLFGNLEGVYLTVEEITIDDDSDGASHGDGDGVIEFNETIELTLTLGNMGMDDAENVIGVVSFESGYVVCTVDEVSFGTIPSDGYGTNSQPFVFHVAHDVPDGESLGASLTVSEDPGTMPLPLAVLAPEYQVGLVEIDDSAGNGDGVPNPGETLLLTFQIENQGGCDTPELEMTLGSGSSYFLPDETPHVLGVIPVGEGVTEGGFQVEITPDCPEIFTGYLRLHFWGPDLYQKMVPLVFSVGQIFADDMEAGGASWTHYAGPGGSWTDEWHMETYRNHTPGGATSWKCGGPGAVDYGNLLHACLETAAFDLPAGSRLSFWHWCAAETSEAHSGYAYDGGLLEISTDGGTTWNGLTPVDGYPFRVRAGGTPGPFSAETPIWAGRHGWREVEVDLAGYEGLVQLRWAFGSDGAVTDEGWYVDDVRIYTQPVAGAEEASRSITRPVLFAARPNPVVCGAGAAPAGEAVAIRFATPQRSAARLQLFDPSGRLIRTLLDDHLAPGTHVATWDGRDAAGHAVPAGSYYYRLAIGEQRLSGRLAIVR